MVSLRSMVLFFCMAYALPVHCLLTVLTHPVSKKNNSKRYGGHTGVTRSLVEGLQKIGVPFNYNPQHMHHIGDVVLVLANVAALQQAIELKKTGRIKKLLAGPNLMVLPNEHGGLLTSKEVDCCIVPSEWIKTAYTQVCPTLAGRIACWPAGVDTNYWLPQSGRTATRRVLVYQKRDDETALACAAMQLLQRYNWDPVYLKYGSYKHAEFKQLLSDCAFTVFVSRAESQGLALAESWAMDVPTFVWNDSGPRTRHGITYSITSACPYLTSATGACWQNIEEFELLLHHAQQLLTTASPRAWVLHNMTDELCAGLMLHIVESI